MSDALSYADELGPAKITHVYEPECGLRATLVVDNVARGPAIGGMRMAPDVTTEECVRLARAMTLKNAMAGLAHGGGKSVIKGDPRMPLEQKQHLVRTFAHALRHEAEYIFGPDMGTDEACMGWVHDEIGRSVGLPESLGGIPLDELGATGWGLASAAKAVEAVHGIRVRGARVAIQGFGAVGRHAARFLVEEGAVLVAASDSHGTLADPHGIDIGELVKVKQSGGVLDYPRGEKLAADAVIDVPCDIWIPAARPDVIHTENAGRLNARVMLQGANIPCTAEAERLLHERKVIIAPDFVANAGGVICAAMEYASATRTAAFQAITDKVGANTEAVLVRARDGAITPREAATAMARERVQAAMTVRRFRIS